MNTIPGSRHSASTVLCLAALFLLALLPRLSSALVLGWNWDYPGSFTLINFDEAGSCRAALKGFDYSTFIGRQTIALADFLGIGPDPDITGRPAAVKAYCHSAGHILVARVYSALAGALTAVMAAMIALLLLPSRPAVAWTSGALVALSGFHISESHSGTVDAPSVFFIYAFMALMLFWARGNRRWGLVLSPLLLVPAVWTKYWLFALFSYASLLPNPGWQYITHGLDTRRVVVLLVATAVLFGLLTNSGFQQSSLYPLLAGYYLLIPWRRVHRPMALFWLLVPVLAFYLCRIELIASYTTGTTYAVISWNKWLRNLVNLPVVLVLGLGLPASLFIPAGIRALAAGGVGAPALLCLSPIVAFALYMAFLAPVTYYRHYLPLIPAGAILAACGLFATRWAGRRWFMLLFFAWPALLAVDLVGDYHRDPRIELRQWYQRHPDARVYFSYYVNPPAGAGINRLFRPEYAFGDAAQLKRAQYLVLSENWYDTAFANELNGPVVSDPSRLVKTRPDYVRFYRETLAGRHPQLEQELVIEVHNFMPELVLHKRLYGTFQLFVGDLRIFRVVD